MGVFGHLAIGLAIKRFTPQIPLWALILSTMFIDILAMTIFVFAPLWSTHGLFMAVVWSFISGIVAALIIKYLKFRKGANNKNISEIRIFHTNMIIFFLVLSHWVIDLLGWSMTGIGIPLLFDDSQLLLLSIEMDLIIGLLIIEFGPFILGLVIYVQYIIKLKKEKQI